jgi:hypothetical protein
MGTPAAEAKPSSAVQYAYMFTKDKGPTVQLDALLRAIAKHIVNPPLSLRLARAPSA